MIYLFAYLLFRFKYRQNHYIYFLINLPLIDAFYMALPGKSFDARYLPNIVVLLICFEVFKKHKFYSVANRTANFLTWFLILLVFSAVFSNNPLLSLRSIFSFSIVLLSFQALYLFFAKEPDSEMHFRQFLNRSFVASVIWVASIIVYNVLNIRLREYYQDAISTGGTGIFEIYPLVYLLILFSAFFRQKRKFLMYIGMLLVSILFFFSLGKRSYIIVLLLGMSVSILGLSKKKSYLAFTIVVFIAFFQIFFSDLLTRLEDVRGSRGEISYYTEGEMQEKEGRVLEFIAYKEEFLKKQPILNIIFGKNIFVEVDYFAHSEYIYSETRGLHSDFSHLLYGTGMLGFLMYLLFFFSILRHLLKSSRRIHHLKSDWEMQLKWIFLGIFAALLFNGFTDGIAGFSNRLIPFALLAAIAGYYKHIEFFRNRPANHEHLQRPPG